MPSPLTAYDVAGRLHNFARDNYLYIGSIIKGTALAAATFVALGVFSDLRTNWPKIIPWIASLFAITVSYMTWGRGVLLTNARSNVLDSIFPLIMGLFEFLLFGVLLPDKEHPFLWHQWFLILALHSLLGFCLVRNRLKNITIVEDFSPALRDLGGEFVQWLKKDMLGASIATGVSFGLWLAMTLLVWPYFKELPSNVVHTVLALAAALFLIKPITEADRQRKRTDTFVSGLLKQGERMNG
jgi:hypothetical protein